MSIKQLADVPKQDEAELKAMATFYANQYGEVWFVRCLHCMRIIACEVPSPAGNLPDRGRQIFGYQDLFITCRTRIDENQHGQKMLGYQCKCGNDTRLGKHEVHEVPTSTTVLDKAGNVVEHTPPPVALSPFEIEQLRSTIKLRQAQDKDGPDYELVNSNTERFETFQLEKVS